MVSPTPDSGQSQSLVSCATTLGLHQIQRHLFLCADQTKPKCCSLEAGLATWNYLKRRLKELGLDQPTAERSGCIFRTKANCLRVCQQGPVLLVYPDGVWYHSVTPDVMETILQEHILNNQVVEAFAFVTHGLEPSVSHATSENLPARDNHHVQGV
jgi:(2Fe-2S) ferredoxin